MEYFDLYDKNGKKLNKLMARGTKSKPGEYHKVVHIWIENSKGEYLVQQRNKSTDRYPYQWAPTAGAVTTGEDIYNAALRETQEEIGLELSKDELTHLDSLYIDSHYTNYIVEVFLIKKEVDLKKLVLDESEVRDVSLFTKTKIFEMIDANMFWDFRTFLPKYDYFSVLEKSI